MKKLKKGQTFKNWKEVCEYMEWEIKTGNSKIAQVKQLESLCKYHTEGRKYIIDEVFEVQKEIKDKRKERFDRLENIQDLEIIILLHIMADDRNKNIDFVKDGIAVYSIMYLMQKTGLINVNYNTCNKNRGRYACYTNTNIKYIHDHFNSTNKTIKSHLFKALDKLDKLRIIDCDKDSKMIVYNKLKGVSNNKIFNEFGDIDEDYEYNIISTRPRLCTDYELDIIRKCQRKALIKLECGENGENEVIKKGKWGEYSKLTNEFIRQQVDFENFKFSFRAIKINYDINQIKQYLYSIGVDDCDIEHYKDRINGLEIENVNKNIENRKGDNVKYDYRNNDDFIETMLRITGDVIDIKHDNITKDIMSLILQ